MPEENKKTGNEQGSEDAVPDKTPEKGSIDKEDPVARGIALGTLLMGAYFLNEVLSEQVVIRKKDGTMIVKKKGPISDIFE